MSTEYQSKPNATAKTDSVDADKALFAKYYVHQIMQMDEDALRGAWNKVWGFRMIMALSTEKGWDGLGWRAAGKLGMHTLGKGWVTPTTSIYSPQATSTPHGRSERDVRLEYLSWRVWFMKRKHEAVRAAQQDHFELSSTGSDSRDISDDEDDGASPSRASSDRQPTSPTASTSSTLTASSGAPAPPAAVVAAQQEHMAEQQQLQHTSSKRASKLKVKFEDIPEEEPTTVDIFNIQRVQGLYIVLISMHGLVRGEHMELGRDPDTGGQVGMMCELGGIVPWSCVGVVLGWVD